MKSIHLLAAAALLVFTPVMVLHAQTSAIDRGSLLVDGDANFTSNTAGVNNEDRLTLLEVTPAVQYFLVPGFAVGGVVALAYSSLNDRSTTAFRVGPAATYFFGKGDRSVYPFVSGQVNLDRSISNFSESRNHFSYRGSGGVLLMLSGSVGLTGELFYRAQNSSSTSSSNSFGLAFGVSAFIF